MLVDPPRGVSTGVCLRTDQPRSRCKSVGEPRRDGSTSNRRSGRLALDAKGLQEVLVKLEPHGVI